MYRELRRQGVVHDKVHDTWLIAGHADVSRMFRSSQASSRAKARNPFRTGSLAFGLFEPQLESLDAPRHGVLRRAFHGMLAPAFEQRLYAHVDATLEALIAEATSTLDVVSELAQPMAALVMARCLGLDDEEARAFQADVGALLLCVRRGELDASDARGAEEAASRLLRVTGEVVRRGSPQAPVAAFCADALAAGASLADVAGNCVLFVAAGQGPTRDLIANGLHALLQNPDQMARLASEPSLVPAAVDETLRYDSPIQIIRRKTAAPIQVAGTTIAAGETLSLVIGAANHDDRVYRAPEQFMPAREEKGHLAFGLARHRCLGTAIARVAAEATFRRLLSNHTKLRLARRPERHASLSFSGLRSLVCTGF